MKKIIKNSLAFLGKHLLRNQSDELLEVRALQLLQPYLNEYFPWSANAVKPSGMLLIINEILIHQRRHVLEVGSGLSTFVLSNLPDVEVSSLEHNDAWSKIVNSYDTVKSGTVLSVPLKDYRSSGFWYDENIIKEKLPENHFNLLFVDGPEKYSRLPALHRLKPYLQEEYSIIIDDINRKDERDMVAEYCREYGLEARFYDRSWIAVLRTQRKDPYFNIACS